MPPLLMYALNLANVDGDVNARISDRHRVDEGLRLGVRVSRLLRQSRFD